MMSELHSYNKQNSQSGFTMALGKDDLALLVESELVW